MIYDPFGGFASKHVGSSVEDKNAVPSGTSNEILDWVGDDEDRAQQAIEVENENDRPRSTLIGKLEKIILDD